MIADTQNSPHNVTKSTIYIFIVDKRQYIICIKIHVFYILSSTALPYQCMPLAADSCLFLMCCLTYSFGDVAVYSFCKHRIYKSTMNQF